MRDGSDVKETTEDNDSSEDVESGDEDQ